MTDGNGRTDEGAETDTDPGADATVDGDVDEDSLAVDGDDLAGVVDLFGGLTRSELDRALSELAFKQGVEPPGEGVLEEAIADYDLVAFDESGIDDPDESGTGRPAALLVPGPASFPRLPDGGADLPHILDVEERTIDRHALARIVERRFRGEVARAVNAGNRERIERLQDVSYDLEAWGPVNLGRMRERLDDALSGRSEE